MKIIRKTGKYSTAEKAAPAVREKKVIKLSNVHKSFGNHEVLKGINLDVHEGEKLVIIGPSGSGKSTTVRCMNGLEMPTSGQVFVDDVELTRKNRINLVRSTSSMVFQQFNLYPHLTVMGNLTLAPIKLFGKSRKEAQELARHYLAVVGLEEKDAISRIESSNLSYGDTTYIHSDYDEGTVIRQSIEAYSDVEEHTRIFIWVSLGPETTPTPEPTPSPTPPVESADPGYFFSN